MLANSATAAVCAGPDNLIVSWNTAAEQLFGYTAEQAIGQPLSIIIPARLRSAHDAGLARAVQSGHARLAEHSVDILALHANGTEIRSTCLFPCGLRRARRGAVSLMRTALRTLHFGLEHDGLARDHAPLSQCG
jgi:PAS domain-containing protein